MNKREVRTRGGLSGKEKTAPGASPDAPCPLYSPEVAVYQPKLREYVKRIHSEHPEASSDIALLARALGIDIRLEFAGISCYIWGPEERIIVVDATMTVPEMVHTIAGLLLYHFMSFADAPVYDVQCNGLFAATYQPNNDFMRMFGDLMLAA